jgi:hypothetical protein
LIYLEPATGYIVFRDRHHRLLDAESITSQMTVRNAGGDPRFSHPLGYDHGRRNIVNSVSFSVDERVPNPQQYGYSQTLPRTTILDLKHPQDNLYSSDETITIANSSEVVQITVQTSDPFYTAFPPIEDVDYFLRNGTCTITLSRTSGQSLTVIITSTSANVIIETMRVRGYMVPVVRTVQVLMEDAQSIEQVGHRVFPNDAPWADRNDSEAIAACILARWSHRLPTLDILVKNYNDVAQTHQLTRKLSDRITVVDSETGINGDFFIEQIRHTIREKGERIHETHWLVESAPVSSTVKPFTFDLAGSGFNDGQFMDSSTNDPATIFTFDGGPGHRFNEGLFAT